MCISFEQSEMVYCNVEVKIHAKIVLLAIIIHHNIAHKVLLKQARCFLKLQPRFTTYNTHWE